MRIISVGADTEHFLVKDGKPYCPFEILPQPKVTDSVHGVACNRDGMAIELNPTPKPDMQTLAEDVRTGLLKLKTAFSADNIQIVAEPRITLRKSVRLPEDVFEIGCVPDRNAYRRGAYNTTSVDAKKFRDRYAGGHIHFGSDEPFSYAGAIDFIKSLDIWFTIPIMAELQKVVGDSLITMARERRAVYGKAGDYRWNGDVDPKRAKRIEYRTPDNLWTVLNPKAVGEIMDRAMARIGQIILPEEALRNAINAWDTTEINAMNAALINR